MIPSAADDPVVSCVLIFFDSARYIDEAIRSVVAQAGFDEWELILVDDGSTDESTTIAKAWAATDPARIRYVEHVGHENRGMSASRNLGVKIARGTYIGFLDCDDVWLPSALAHRMRVAAAHPAADLVVGGTWRWHSWSGDDADLTLDRQMTLPVAPLLTTLDAPQLFSAIYGLPGGGHVPAMCSFLIRRDALVAIGGMESQFRGLYEDQVLYVKAGLKLSAVIDSRPLALYRQHPASACSVSISKGDWSPVGPSEPVSHFFSWMQDYTRDETGDRSAQWKIVQRNIAYFRLNPEQRARAPRELLRRHARAFFRRLRDRLGGTHQEASPISVLAQWSSQFLRVITASMSGATLVIVPTSPSDELWTCHIPDDAWGSIADVDRQPLDSVDRSVRFDHIVVPFDVSVEMPTSTLLAALRRLLQPGGTVAALLPGRAWVAPTGSAAVAATHRDNEAGDVARMAREHFPDMQVSVETFGNAVTARAVAAGSPASVVRGVAIDHHDPQTQVLLALLISKPRKNG